MTKRFRVLQWDGDKVEEAPQRETPRDWRNVRKPAHSDPMTKEDKIDRIQNGLLLFTMSSVTLVFAGLAFVAFCAIIYAIVSSLF
jgi:hypothetical protein